MENEIIHLLDSRRSHRAYASTQLTEEQLQSLLKVALASPSASNQQPWHFTAVQNQDLLNRISDAAHKTAAGQAPADRSPRFSDPAFHVFYHAPTVIFISSNPAANKALDCGIAVISIALAAESMGLGSVILALPKLAFAGDEKAALEQALGLPDGHSVTIAIALGTPADTKEPPERNPRKHHIIR